MNFKLDQATEILSRTPSILKTVLQGLPDELFRADEGGETWSIYDVVGHLVHGEKTDWMPRAEIILSDNPDKKFPEFDRFAQFEESEGKAISELLGEFEALRFANLKNLRSKNLSAFDLGKKGIHPVFGEVTLSQLLATWVVHDLAHISQISRILAKQYKEDVGPWFEYLRVLKQ